MRKIITVISTVIFLSCTLSASWLVLRKPLSFKAGAVGVSDIDNFQSYLDNPSVLVEQKSKNIMSNLDIGHFGDAQVSFGFVLPLNKNVLGIGFSYLDVGNTEITYIEDGELKQTSYSALREVLLCGAYSLKVKEFLNVGLNIKTAVSTIAESYTAYAFVLDPSITYILKEKTFFIFNLKNLGFSTRYGDENLNPPISLSLTAAHNLDMKDVAIRPSLGFMYEFIDNTPFFSFGLNSKVRNLDVFFNYITKDIGSFSFGFIVNIGKFSFGYSTSLPIILNLPSKVFLSYKF